MHRSVPYKALLVVFVICVLIQILVVMQHVLFCLFRRVSSILI